MSGAAGQTPEESAERRDQLSAQDAKLIVLARGARGRAGSDQGAAVRDTDGRSYAGAAVAMRSLSLSAIQVAVATAVASGADELEAAVVVTAAPVTDIDRAVIAEMSCPVVIVVGFDGAVQDLQGR